MFSFVFIKSTPSFIMIYWPKNKNSQTSLYHFTWQFSQMKISSTVLNNELNTGISPFVLLWQMWNSRLCRAPAILASPATLHSATSLVSEHVFSCQALSAFNFDESNLSIHFFHWSCFLCHIWAILPKVTNLSYVLLFLNFIF